MRTGAKVFDSCFSTTSFSLAFSLRSRSISRSSLRVSSSSRDSFIVSWTNALSDATSSNSRSFSNCNRPIWLRHSSSWLRNSSLLVARRFTSLSFCRNNSFSFARCVLNSSRIFWLSAARVVYFSW